jgi:hypothetical protein
MVVRPWFCHPWTGRLGDRDADCGLQSATADHGASGKRSSWRKQVKGLQIDVGRFLLKKQPINAMKVTSGGDRWFEGQSCAITHTLSEQTQQPVNSGPRGAHRLLDQ